MRHRTLWMWLTIVVTATVLSIGAVAFTALATPGDAVTIAPIVSSRPVDATPAVLPAEPATPPAPAAEPPSATSTGEQPPSATRPALTDPPKHPEPSKPAKPTEGGDGDAADGGDDDHETVHPKVREDKKRSEAEHD